MISSSNTNYSMIPTTINMKTSFLLGKRYTKSFAPNASYLQMPSDIFFFQSIQNKYKDAPFYFARQGIHANITKSRLSMQHLNYPKQGNDLHKSPYSLPECKSMLYTDSSFMIYNQLIQCRRPPPRLASGKKLL